MTLLFGIGLSFIRLIPGEYYAAQRLQTDTAGYYVADAGVTLSLAWLESIGPEGVATNNNNDWQSFSATYPATAGSSPTLSGLKNFTTGSAAPNPTPASMVAAGTWTTTPTQVSNSLLPGWTFNAQVQRYNYRIDADAVGTFFVIVSEASRPSRSGGGADTFRRIRCWARPGSFADDAYAVDVLPSDIWLNLANFKLTGPYRTNGRCLLYTPTNFWPSPAAASPRPAAINGSVTFWRGNSDANLKKHNIGGVDTVVDGVTYSDHNDQTRLPFNKTSGAQYPARYAEITVNGRAGINYSNNRQDMPENTENVAAAALNAAAPSPNVSPMGATNSTAAFYKPSPGATPQSVNVHAASTSGGLYNRTMTGGLYFEGTVDDIVLSAPSASDGNGNPSDGNVNSRMVVKQGSKDMAITQVYESLTIPAGAKINGATTGLSTSTTISSSTNGKGYTVIQDLDNPNDYAVYDGTGNGAIYCTGDIGGLRGVNRGRKTFATRMDTGNNTAQDKNITITGNLTRADTTPGQNVTGTRDQLGVLSYKVIIADNLKLKKDDGTAATRASTTTSNPLYIYGAFVLGRDNDPNENSMITGGGMGSASYDNALFGEGHFKLFGSLTEGVRQVKGLIGTSGNSYQYNYDPNMSTLPPPWFPAKSRFRIDAWNEEAVFNY